MAGTAGCGGSDTIGKAELAELPEIVVVAADPGRAKFTAAGDLYLLRPDSSTLDPVKSWAGRVDESRPGVAYGVSYALWSPDRTEIGVSLDTWDGDPYLQLAVVQRDGGAVKRVTRPAGQALRAWTPDGARMVFEEIFFGGQEGLWSVPVSGGEPSRYEPAAIRQLGKHNSRRGFAPSPDGTRLAADGILVADVSTLGVRRLTQRPARGAVWSMDGRSIAYTRTTKDGTDVHAMRSDGSEKRQLTTDGASTAVGWSPDGTKVLFMRDVPIEEGSEGVRPELWVMDADGGRQTRLPFNDPELRVLAADWGPPGRS